ALDVACGTGYWTRRIAQRALAITGCDQSPEVLALARERQPTANHVQFVIGNAFSLSDLSGEFDAAFVGFWWSHVPREDLSRFVRGLHERLLPRSRVFIVDNRYVAGSNWPITRTDSSGNTYQHRVLDNGVGHEVLKNFPAASELQTALTGAGARDVDIQELPYYWYAAYELAP
ncbi:MAG TPA: class I SAM-dependent methyltransferase, partial [Gemmatimonadaceae bacterium]|nr:class I SAM-dependent methyltransferase [Gemmatimonadaceae bacterium]